MAALDLTCQLLCKCSSRSDGSPAREELGGGLCTEARYGAYDGGTGVFKDLIKPLLLPSSSLVPIEYGLEGQLPLRFLIHTQVPQDALCSCVGGCWLVSVWVYDRSMVGTLTECGTSGLVPGSTSPNVEIVVERSPSRATSSALDPRWMATSNITMKRKILMLLFMMW